jgi:hypothetical protein
VIADKSKCEELIAFRTSQRQRRKRHESSSAEAEL